MSDCCGKKDWAEPCDPCPDLTQIQPVATGENDMDFVKAFIEKELEQRRASCLPDDDPYIQEAEKALASLQSRLTFTFDSEDGVGTVVFNDGEYGPGFTVKAPDGTEYTGFIDLFHFKPGEENCLQIVVDPVQGDHDTFHARFYPDGRVVTYVE
jgi:hypothetical protein